MKKPEKIKFILITAITLVTIVLIAVIFAIFTILSKTSESSSKSKRVVSSSGETSAQDTPEPETYASEEESSAPDTSSLDSEPTAEPTPEKTLKDFSLDAYERFLNNAGIAYMDRSGNGDGYKLSDFLDYKVRELEGENYSYSNLQYAYIDCGNDGILELLLAYSIDGDPNNLEGSYDYQTVIKYSEDRLFICGEALSHYRRWEGINQYGILSTGFVDFAGANVWNGFYGFDASGSKYSIMSQSSSSADAIPGMYFGYEGEPDFRDLYDKSSNGLCDVYIEATTIEYGSRSGEEIYSYQLFEGADIDESIVLDALSSSGVKYYSYSDYTRQTDDVIREFGLTPDMFYADEPKFTNI